MLRLHCKAQCLRELRRVAVSFESRDSWKLDALVLLLVLELPCVILCISERIDSGSTTGPPETICKAPIGGGRLLVMTVPMHIVAHFMSVCFWPRRTASEVLHPVSEVQMPYHPQQQIFN